MPLALLIDFGSTFTKLTVLHRDEGRFVARTAVPTTPAHIVGGLRAGLARLENEGLKPSAFGLKLACSSAAGGLRLVAVGLVPDLTAEAARRAALGAGARVIGTFAYELTEADTRRMRALEPDVLLVAGGTDGGNRRVILHNCRRLARAGIDAPVVLAGNSEAAPEAAAVLRSGGVDVRVASNVMPALGVIDVEPARVAIRTLFLERIVKAKGLHAAEQFIDGVLMPTPAAVLEAARLLAFGTADTPGYGQVAIVDVGGATTDVHSVAPTRPADARVILRGLPEPTVKRTVEGDLGMRVSARSLVDAVGAAVVAERAGLPADEVVARAERLHLTPDAMPTDDAERRLDFALAATAVHVAMTRHAGRREERATPLGVRRFQTGKDLSAVRYVIGTGGIIVHSDAPRRILAAATAQPAQPDVLAPRQPRLLLDEHYVLAAAGLLAQKDAPAALRVLRTHLRHLDADE